MYAQARAFSVTARRAAAAATATATKPAAPTAAAARMAAVRKVQAAKRPVPAASVKPEASQPTAAAAAKAAEATAASTSPAEPAPAAAPKPSVTKTIAPAAAMFKKPVVRSAPKKAPVADEMDSFFPEQGIADYANLGAGKAVASPPLTSLPGEGYVPLPSVMSAPSRASSSQASSSSPTLGSQTMADGYVFTIPGEKAVEDWTTSFRGLSAQPFDKDVASVLLRPLEVNDIEVKPDGLLYLPEIKYRRTLNLAFGPGGWGLAPRGETHVGPNIVSREWGLVCLGRLVGVARGEQEYFNPNGIPTATEACKSNALMRCCKDLGIASELWDPTFIREFKAKYCVEAMVEHQGNKKKRKLWRKKSAKFEYPYKELSTFK